LAGRAFEGLFLFRALYENWAAPEVGGVFDVGI